MHAFYGARAAAVSGIVGPRRAAFAFYPFAVAATDHSRRPSRSLSALHGHLLPALSARVNCLVANVPPPPICPPVPDPAPPLSLHRKRRAQHDIGCPDPRAADSCRPRYCWSDECGRENPSSLCLGKLRITEHLFEVPRDYARPAAGNIQLFARSARKAEKPADPAEADSKKQLPWFVYLQGGPGFECRSPQNFPWTNTVLDRGYQVLCLDQRGTGLSTAISYSTLGLRGDDPVQAGYLKSFRADSIVKDCEAIRQALTASYPPEKQKWSIMGQSFGGFCATTYLSFFPEGLREVFICGGLPPLVNNPDEVYERLYKKVLKRNEAYYAKYPEDVDRVKQIARLLQRFGNAAKVGMPSGGILSARKFQQLGLSFGFHGMSA